MLLFFEGDLNEIGTPYVSGFFSVVVSFGWILSYTSYKCEAWLDVIFGNLFIYFWYESDQRTENNNKLISSKKKKGKEQYVKNESE